MLKLLEFSSQGISGRFNSIHFIFETSSRWLVPSNFLKDSFMKFFQDFLLWVALVALGVPIKDFSCCHYRCSLCVGIALAISLGDPTTDSVNSSEDADRLRIFREIRIAILFQVFFKDYSRSFF